MRPYALSCALSSRSQFSMRRNKHFPTWTKTIFSRSAGLTDLCATALRIAQERSLSLEQDLVPHDSPERL